jgi:transposase-like protein
LKNPSVQTLISALQKLSTEDFLLLKSEVQRQEKNQAIEALWHSKVTETKKCPHCESNQIYKNGKKDGRQRFRCNACKKTFNALTNTPLSRLRYSEKHLQQTEAMLEGLSIRKASAKLGVSIPTAFLWRHRFLMSLEKEQPEKLGGIVEADETFFLQNYKGQVKPIPRASKKRGTPAKKRGLSKEQVPVLIARERTSKNTLTQIMPGRTAVDLANILNPVLSKDAMVCADGAKMYKKMGRTEGVAVRSRKNARSGTYHIQNVNAACQRLKGWMFPFKGVATRYLPNYLGWRRFMELRDNLTPSEFWKAAAG